MTSEIYVTIKDVEYKVKKGVGSLMLFEDITGLNSLYMKGNFNNTVMMFYAMIKFNNKNFEYTKEQFIDLLDEDETLLPKYTDYLVSFVVDKSDDDEKKK
jgi:hypothetical protein